MSSVGGPKHDPVPIGDVAAPELSVGPDPGRLFAARAARFHVLAEVNAELGGYLGFLARLAEAQHNAQAGLPQPELPPADDLDRVREFGMPPLDRSPQLLGAVFEKTCDRFFALAVDPAAPPAAAAALACVTGASDVVRRAMAATVMEHAIPGEELAEHVYVAAALQVHFARLAARLDHSRLVPVGETACPACGSPPVASVLTASAAGAQVSRYCTCSLCATAWHYVRIKCVACGSTGGITYQAVEGGSPFIKAETCDSCRCYVKIFHRQEDPALDPVADDVASLGLDLLVGEGGYRRAAVNVYLQGY